MLIFNCLPSSYKNKLKKIINLEQLNKESKNKITHKSKKLLKLYLEYK